MATLLLLQLLAAVALDVASLVSVGVHCTLDLYSALPNCTTMLHASEPDHTQLQSLHVHTECMQSRVIGFAHKRYSTA